MNLQNVIKQLIYIKRTVAFNILKKYAKKAIFKEEDCFSLLPYVEGFIRFTYMQANISCFHLAKKRMPI